MTILKRTTEASSNRLKAFQTGRVYQGKTMKESAVLVQGVVHDSLFDVFKKQKIRNVLIMEGRPRLKAAKILSQQLLKRKITPTLIADNMAGFLFYKKMIKEVWVAYQVVDPNGALCDVGGLILGVLGKQHKIPVYLYPCGWSSGSLGLPQDLLNFNGTRVAPQNVKTYVPLMEWVPKKYITKVYA